MARYANKNDCMKRNGKRRGPVEAQWESICMHSSLYDTVYDILYIIASNHADANRNEHTGYE